jgi:quaternary ammonium compound-resistance protein SugE
VHDDPQLLADGRGIHIGTAYAVWTGIGASGTAILGMILFQEPRDIIRLSCLALIIAGVVGLKFFSPPPDASLAKNPTTIQTDASR